MSQRETPFGSLDINQRCNVNVAMSHQSPAEVSIRMHFWMHRNSTANTGDHDRRERDVFVFCTSPGISDIDFDER